MKSNRLATEQIGGSSAAHISNSARRWGNVARAALIVAVSCVSGCASLQGLNDNLAYCDSMNDFVMGWRNTAWARQSWHDQKFMHVDEPQFVTFGEGYRDGYADVAGGGNGCVPAIPPRKFWTWKYQTGEGQAKVAAWFAGYPYGARAAAEDGAGNFQQIQVSHLIEAQYSPAFRNGMCPGCDPTFLPGGPGMEVLPGVGELTPMPTPATGAPLLDRDSSTQFVPAGGQPMQLMQGVGPIAPASYVEPAQARNVFPAVAQDPHVPTDNWQRDANGVAWNR